MSLLEVKNLSHTINGKVLYKNCSFELLKNEHMGLVGQNGTGKTTLMNIINDRVSPDACEIQWQRGLKIGYLDQHAEIEKDISIFNFLKKAFSHLYEVEQKLNTLYGEMSDSISDDVADKIERYQNQLMYSGFYDLEATILKIASGLGIVAIGVDKKLSEISGGQRAKVILAKLLLEDPDVLLLDEPTNFLDKEHISWLKDFLKEYHGAFIVISHDFDFLNQVTNCIIDIEFSQIKKYTGNFDQFMQLKMQNRETYQQTYSSQQRTIAKLEDYISRNSARASTARMAQSRQKQLDRIDVLPPAQTLPKPHFNLVSTNPPNGTVLVISKLLIGYDSPLLPEFNLKIEAGEKIVISGFNGIGKSTLMKTIVGQIPQLGGSYEWGNKTQIAYFEQDLNWEDNTWTPFKIISKAFPEYDDGTIRKFLAQCGIKGKLAMKSISLLSGGEQTRVKICILMLTKANFLILDEPTNHLDADSKQVLKQQLINWQGCIILVSHEEKFYEGIVDKIVRASKK